MRRVPAIILRLQILRRASPRFICRLTCGGVLLRGGTDLLDFEHFQVFICAIRTHLLSSLVLIFSVLELLLIHRL